MVTSCIRHLRITFGRTGRLAAQPLNLYTCTVASRNATSWLGRPQLPRSAVSLRADPFFSAQMKPAAKGKAVTIIRWRMNEAVERSDKNTSTPAVSSEAIGNAVAAIRRKMDHAVVGHSQLKEALLLGLLAREHIYIEGPPGVGKTLLAEIAAEATSLDPVYFYQLHRDTRLQELIGDAVIHRELDANSGGEVIRQANLPGGILTAQVCVLDDITRAPGEALNVLLRILNVSIISRPLSSEFHCMGECLSEKFLCVSGML